MSATNGFTTITKFSPGSPFVEAFGLLTASLLLQNGKEGGIRIICVLGAEEGAGASTTALNLALTVANAGRRTLLIDANLRSPTLHHPFNLPQSPGFGEILSKKVMVKDAVRASKLSNFYLLPSGAVTGSPSASMQPQLLGAIFDQVKAGYDFAIVDTAPVLRYADALHLARFTDGVLLVMPADGARRRAELEVRRRLERVDVNVLGIVLNRSSQKEAMAR
ncbi:MAG: CpsD/CapB family tyrosine-protein kinase [bacterium]